MLHHKGSVELPRQEKKPSEQTLWCVAWSMAYRKLAWHNQKAQRSADYKNMWWKTLPAWIFSVHGRDFGTVLPGQWLFCLDFSWSIPNQQGAAVAMGSWKEDREKYSQMYCECNDICCCTRAWPRLLALNTDSDTSVYDVLNYVFPFSCLLLAKPGLWLVANGVKLPEWIFELWFMFCAKKCVAALHQTQIKGWASSDTAMT